MENTKKENVLKRFASAVGGNNLVLIGAIIVVFILFTAINPNYLTWTNFVNLLVAASLVGIVAVGHTYLIIAGQNAGGDSAVPWLRRALRTVQCLDG